jgi:hypothetical protein
MSDKIARQIRERAVIAAARAVMKAALPEIVPDPDKDLGHVTMRALMNLRDALAELK